MGKKIDEERIGVEGSLHRRILDLCKSLGLVLIDARDLGHSSTVTLIFRDDKCLAEITIEHTDLDDPRPILLSENEKLRAALTGLEMLFSREGESATDRYERVADAFFGETGYMRPGKSQPLEVTHSDENRTLVYESWIEGKLLAAREALARAKEASRGA